MSRRSNIIKANEFNIFNNYVQFIIDNAQEKKEFKNSNEYWVKLQKLVIQHVAILLQNAKTILLVCKVGLHKVNLV